MRNTDSPVIPNAGFAEFAQAYFEKSDMYAHIVVHDDLFVEERLAALDTLQALLEAAQDVARNPQRRHMIEVDRIFFSDNWSPLPSVLDAMFESDDCATFQRGSPGNFWMQHSVIRSNSRSARHKSSSRSWRNRAAS